VVFAIGVCLKEHKYSKPKEELDYTIDELEWYITLDRMMREGNQNDSAKADEKVCSNIEKLIERIKE